MPTDADLEIGLRWDRRSEALFASLRFDIAGENIDIWEQPEEPIALDLDRLRLLKADDDGYGEALTSMVLRPGDVGKFYEEALAATEGNNDLTVHVRLHISAPPPFHSVRWELLRDPRNGNAIAMQSGVLLSRYLSSPDWRPIPALPRHDLRVLAVVAGPSDISSYAPRGSGLAEVYVEEELDRASAALATFANVQTLGRGQATLPAILAVLDQGVDVLYLVCHGAVHEDVPLIFLERPDGKADVVDARKLVERLLGLKRRPTVVMLCSCQSAGGDNGRRTDDDGELAALAPRLASAGVSAVVGMQGNVTMETANAFAPRFFEALAEDGIVDRAMSAARRTIADRGDWWVPVLFSRLRSGRTYYQPEFTERGYSAWQNLRLRIPTGNFTPVLGPGLADAILGSRQDMARGFVERWQMPLARHSQGDLAQVAQYLLVNSAEGTVRAQLFDYLTREIARRSGAATDPNDPFWKIEPDPLRPGPSIVEIGRRLRKNDDGDPYRVMAALPAKVYVTTGWTNLLQDALLDAPGGPREAVTRVFRWNDDGIGGADDLAVEPTQEHPLVYHLFGRFDHPGSIVLSEEDYFGWFTAWHTRRELIPALVRSSLVEKSLLFIGFRLDDWDFRVIFHAIKSLGGRELLRKNQHVGVQLNPENPLIEPEAAQEYLESYFGEDKVDIYWGDTRRFLDELRARTGLQT